MEAIQILGNVGNDKCKWLIVYDGDYHSKFMYRLAAHVCCCLLHGRQSRSTTSNIFHERKRWFAFPNYLASISRIIALGKSTFAVMRLVLKDPSNRDTSILLVPASVQ